MARVLRAGDIVGLHGELGAGKTVLVRGIASGLGISERKVRSPSFTLINEYRGGRLPVYHMDLYRLAPDAIDAMALREYLCGEGVCIIEWFERLSEPHEHLSVTLTFVGSEERRIVVTACGDRYVGALNFLENG